MAESLIDLRMLLVEKEDCDAGTVQKVREGLTQGAPQFKALREANDALKKKLSGAAPAQAKKLALKLGVTNHFLGYTGQEIEYLRQAEGALANFLLGKALASRGEYDEALQAFDRAEKAGYNASTVQLQRAGLLRHRGDLDKARNVLQKHQDLASHSSEYHYQVAGVHQSEGDQPGMIKSLEKAVELDPGHTGALFQLGYANDLAGNDDEAIGYYERCLKYPPYHLGVLNN